MYKLKSNQESFEIVDGPYAGKKYKAGQVYEDIPPQEKHRFEKQRTEARCQVSGVGDRRAEGRGRATVPAKEPEESKDPKTTQKKTVN